MKDHIRKQVYLRPDQDKAIKHISADTGQDQSEIIREAIDQYLSKKPGT
jgi:predicted DNA-binding protein